MIKKILIAVFLLACILRFWNLSGNPPALTWDEVSWGYNAYTLGQTGKDEFGKFLPVTYLESFGDFKPPVYAYLSIIPVKIFGLNEFATRFASAFFGSLTVLLSFFLVKELFSSSSKRNQIGIFTCFLLAISPWHILLSRAAFEANVATFFIVLGVYLFLLSTRDKRCLYYLAFSLVSFAAAMYTFNTSRVFIPIFLPFLFYFRKKSLLQNIKVSIICILPAAILCIPLFLFLLTPQAKLRYQEVNIFSDSQVIERVNTEVANDNNSALSKIIHNRRFTYGVEYVKHYLDNLDPSFLFIKGDGNPKFSIQDVGQMYIWELPFLILGGLLMFRKKEEGWKIIPVWLLLGIVPAATARETPHALRIETVIPMMQIIVAYGFIYSFDSIFSGKKNKWFKNLIFITGVIIIFSTFVYFIHNYFNNYPSTYASEWQYGYKQAIQYAELHKQKYENIYMTQDFGRPYIYALFFGRYPEGSLTDADITREAFGFVHVNSFGKYKFLNQLPNDKKNSLYINTSGKEPRDAKILETIKLPNGISALTIYEK